jgi:alkanesulfonate monooxygenase SsuD/methylene tetrahydromethanopterin reductase-like flavin-dependent oxidoreductase (luciferase family)
MNVGLYFDLRNPPPWRQDPGRLYAFNLELCAQADRLGAHSLWFTEHHLTDDDYLPQSLTLLGAVAARTSGVRLGTSLLIAPLHDPVHVAEQAAIVDIVSGGRLELGVGAGYRVPEFELFGVDPARRGPATFELVRRLRAIWADGRVTPPPLQERLPIWVGANGEWSARQTGRLGEGLLRVAPELLEPLRAGLAEGGHDPGSARMTGAVNAFLSDDPERDWPVVAARVAYQANMYARYAVDGTGGPLPPPIDADELRARGFSAGSMRGFVFGTPEQVAPQIRAVVADAPVATVYLWATVSGLPEALAERNVELATGPLRELLSEP